MNETETSQFTSLTAIELKERLASGGLNLVDVRLADDHAAEHLPAATNNCVFEVQFVSRLEEEIPDRATPICVYGLPMQAMSLRWQLCCNRVATNTSSAPTINPTGVP